MLRQWRFRWRNFNPRSPHGERPTNHGSCFPSSTFQPTLPARGATGIELQIFKGACPFQPTLPARGATEPGGDCSAIHGISTHAPRTGSDQRHAIRCIRAGKISTHAPRTGSDARVSVPPVIFPISTHAPRTGSDRKQGVEDGGHCDFNPRSPHGERHRRTGEYKRSVAFQPTLPARGATKAPDKVYQ